MERIDALVIWLANRFSIIRKRFSTVYRVTYLTAKGDKQRYYIKGVTAVDAMRRAAVKLPDVTLLAAVKPGVHS